MVLPRTFPEYLPKNPDGHARPGGYAAFGAAWEQGRETPVGFTKRTIGFPRVGITCAVCHTATYRTTPDEPHTIVPTGPTQRFDVQSYVRFLDACASDPRFNADKLLYQIKYNVKLSWLDKLLYRYVIVPQTRKGMLRQKERNAWTYEHNRPLWGPGRIDPFNPVKFHQLGLSDDGTIGNSDMMPIWNLASRRGQWLHWDGLNTDATEVVMSGAIGDGATNKSLPFAKLKQLEGYLSDKQPPSYPFLESLDPQLVSRGRVVFQSHCADCHAPGGSRTGKVILLSEIGTDSNRALMWTSSAVERYSHYSDGYPWDFRQFTDVDGYVAVPLGGLWLRAPYLHNGSVPTLEDLLKPAPDRPKTFYRGYDVYDRTNTGFITDGDAARDAGFPYDTRLPGNSNEGHDGESYGTTIPENDKRALVEYLRTM
jgi:mono/diheme cytochrome c family protein